MHPSRVSLIIKSLTQLTHVSLKVVVGLQRFGVLNGNSTQGRIFLRGDTTCFLNRGASTVPLRFRNMKFPLKLFDLICFVMNLLFEWYNAVCKCIHTRPKSLQFKVYSKLRCGIGQLVLNLLLLLHTEFMHNI